MIQNVNISFEIFTATPYLVLACELWGVCWEYLRDNRHAVNRLRYLIAFQTSYLLNTLRPRQNVRRFADDTFKRIFLNENVRIPIEISLKFVPKGPINNIPALVQIMARRRPDNKPLSAPMMVSLLMHICVTRPQWVNSLRPNDAYMHL